MGDKNGADLNFAPAAIKLRFSKQSVGSKSYLEYFWNDTLTETKLPKR